MAQQKKNLSRPLLAAAVVVVLLAAIGIGWMLGRGGSDEPTQPATASQGSSSAPSGGDTDGICGLPVGSQEVPQEGPEARWEIRRQLTVPSAPDYGPGATTEGAPSCFAHNPMGAVFFVLNFQGMTPEQQAGRIKDGEIEPQGGEETITAKDVLTVRAFKAEAKGPDRVDMTIVYGFGSGPLTAIPASAVWVDGDWKIDGTALGGGSEQVTSLDGFVEWGPK